jgi:hypothetical protein
MGWKLAQFIETYPSCLGPGKKKRWRDEFQGRMIIVRRAKSTELAPDTLRAQNFSGCRHKLYMVKEVPDGWKSLVVCEAMFILME